MTPYYSDDLVTLFHGDYREVDDWLRANALVTDPPYGIDYRSNRPRRDLAAAIRGDNDVTARDLALDHWYMGDIDPRDDRPALVFGSWRRPRPVWTRQVLIWDTKGALGMGDLSLPWKPSHQEIYVLGTGFVGRRDSDVITCAPVQSLGYNGRSHPHQKPVALMVRLIDKCPMGVIADPFAGIGSTLVAAKQLGRPSIGVEIEERYCEIAAKRMQQESIQFEPLNADDRTKDLPDQLDDIVDKELAGSPYVLETVAEAAREIRHLRGGAA